MSFKVGDQYRTNSLSNRPGGVSVMVEYSDGRVKEYDKVKYPAGFISKVKQDSSVTNAYVKK